VYRSALIRCVVADDHGGPCLVGFLSGRWFEINEADFTAKHCLALHQPANPKGQLLSSIPGRRSIPHTL